MKKYFLYLVAIAAAIVATSCSRVESPSGMGEESTLTFVVSTPEISTRAVADGTNATDLYYGVYAMSKDADGEVWTLQGDISKTTTPVGINLTTQVNLTLVNGKEYSLLFWAENPASKAEVDWAKLEMSYTPEYSNHDVYDAFYAYVPTFKVTGSINQDVTLKRPFAQLNIGANDMAAAKAAGMEVAKTEVTVEGVYSGMSLVTGAVTGQELTVTYQMYDISPIKGEVFPVVNNTYMAMNYLLVNAEKDLSVITLKYEGTDGVTYTRTYNSVPVQRNWRTNIYGSILTDEAKYNVTIEPEFADEENPENVYNREFPDAKTAQQIIDVMSNGGSAVLAQDIEINDADVPATLKSDETNSIHIRRHVVIDLNGYKLTYGGSDAILARIENGGSLEFRGSVEGSEVFAGNAYVASANAGGVIKVYGGKYSTNSTTLFQANGGKVYIADGEFSNENTEYGATYLLNHIDAKKEAGLIEVSGGVFKNFNPAESSSENPVMNFVKDGYSSIENGGSFFVLPETVEAVAGKQEELAEALSSGKSNIFLAEGTYTLPSSGFSSEDVITCAPGTVFTGNSKLNIEGATIIGAKFSNPGGTAVDQTINGTLKDCTFEGYNGLRWTYAGETVVFENCVFSGDLYGVHFDGGANDVIFRNCTISGFNALGGALTMVTFEGCTFKGNGKSGYNGANLWGSAKMIDCEFTFDGSTSYEWIDCIGADKTYEFKNCTVNGVPYTPENYTQFEDIFSRYHVTVKINGTDCAM